MVHCLFELHSLKYPITYFHSHMIIPFFPNNHNNFGQISGIKKKKNPKNEQRENIYIDTISIIKKILNLLEEGTFA